MWGKENLVKDRKVSKYYETDCSITMTICLSETFLNSFIQTNDDKSR